MKIAQLYAGVTASIIKEMEQGAIPWLKCWKGSSIGMLPANAVTKRAYSGVNIPILWSAAIERGYPTHRWLTFKQALDVGACVRYGETGTFIVFTKPLLFRDKETEEEKKARMLRTFCVFNIAQVEGLDIVAEPAPPTMVQRHAAADAFIAATNANISLGGDRACYMTGWDKILLPHLADFHDAEQFYGVAFHELTHWTAAPHRLQRDLSGKYKDKLYSFEEIIAELGSAFLCAHLGIKAELRHAGYIQSYLEVLKDDDKAFFSAAAKAQQAADYLRSFSETAQAEESIEQ